MTGADARAETDEARRRRIAMRCWRRGTREMDLILGAFADTRLGTMDARGLDALEALLSENDQDLYAWFTGREPEPDRHGEMLGLLRDFYKIG